MSMRVQVSVAGVQLQPGPASPVTESPLGNVSTTVTVEPSVAIPPTLATLSVYVLPTAPRFQTPECDLVIVKSGFCTMSVESPQLLLAVLVSPPPDTVA